jgi:hypothetical protein
MKRYFINVATFTFLVLLFMSLMEAANTTKKSSPPSDSMTVMQARSAVVAGLKAVHSYHLAVDPNSFRFTFDSVEFDATIAGRGSEHFKVDLKSLPPVIPKRRWDGGYLVKDEAGGDRDIPRPLNQIIFWGKDRAADAALLAAGLNSLRGLAMGRQAAQSGFTQQAAAWRAMATKPPIPEAVRLHRLLAEDALKKNQPEEALDHYENGLLAYPTWPQGWFNAALIAAELGRYADAVEKMRAYLELVPDAQDAQSARDQIAIWQYKAGQPVPAANPNTPRTH